MTNNQSPRAGDGTSAGWKLVPVEPTARMLNAGCCEYRAELTGDDCGPSAAEVRALAEAYRAMLAAAPAAAPAWQPIETAPKDGTSVLLLTAQGAIEAFFQHGEWEQTVCMASYDMANVYIDCRPTHWMPLPAAPAFESPATAEGSQS